jgi:hydroxymethylpyrimidine/phosphomethylpyrimidine kinase
VTAQKGRVLVVAGSDSGGGAGIQADLKTVAAFGGYGMTAITAVTAQNTLGVFGVHTIPAAFVRDQMIACLDDIGADAIKIGMLAGAGIADAVADVLESPAAAGLPVVLDTVTRATSGAALLDAAGVDVLKRRLIPRATLITPNLPEAEALTGVATDDASGMMAAAEALLAMGARNVLLKGGHLPGDQLVDVLAGREGRAEFRHLRIASRHTHGTGCTLAAAIAACLAQGCPLAEAVGRAIGYVQAAIRNAPGLGQGAGPLGHAPRPPSRFSSRRLPSAADIRQKDGVP